MRVFYADPGLVNNLGHHASSCRFITRELRRRGIQANVLAFTKLDPAVQTELCATPYFRTFTYWITDGDPVCGWLNAYLNVGQTMSEDLKGLTDIGGDILYLNSGQAAQLLGLARWASGLQANDVPHIVFEFGVDPGMDVEYVAEETRLATRDPRKDARAILLRHAAQQIPKALHARFHLMTFEPNSSAAYAALLGLEVGTLPLPRPAITELRHRTGKRPIMVAVLGHQRADKGYHLVPEIARQLLSARPDVQLLVHNGEPNGMVDIQSAMRALAETNRRLIIDERLANEQIWATLLDSADIVLCPYDAARFSISYSAVAADAVANAIPLVVPQRSSLARLIAEFGNTGTTFTKTTPECIVAATLQAIDNFDEYATRAFVGARQWGQLHGPASFVNALLSVGV